MPPYQAVTDTRKDERREPPPGQGPELEEKEKRKADEEESLNASITYEVVRREGEKELERSPQALAWSGLAAGLSMGFILIAEGLLRSHLPDASWRPLIAKLGYSFGFLIVILGSQQLFTENTLTPIVPLLSDKTRKTLRNVLRLWSAVFVANILGTLLFGLALGRLAVVEPQTQRVLSDLAREAMQYDVPTTLLRAVYAGWLIALLVWMLPGAERSKLAVIVLMTWLIGAGG